MERDIFPFIANKYLKDSPPSSPHDANFYYDGDGNRVLSITDDGATEYIGDYYEYEVGTGITRSYCGSGLAMRVAGAPDPKKANGVFYLLKDHLGSTNLTLDSGGNLVGEMRYKAWGETRYVSGTTLTDFAYTGQRQELELGFYYYKARWGACPERRPQVASRRNPALDRFMQADSIIPHTGSPQSLNRYAYVMDNPLGYTDPTGNRDRALDPGGGFGSCEDMNGDLICDSTLIDLLQPTPTKPNPTPMPTPTPAQDPSSTPTYWGVTPTSTSYATLRPLTTATPSSTPIPHIIFPTPTPNDELMEDIAEAVDGFLNGFSLHHGTSGKELFPHDWLTPLEQIPDPRVQGAVQVGRRVLQAVGTLKDLYDRYGETIREFIDGIREIDIVDPIYPLPYPVQQYPE